MIEVPEFEWSESGIELLRLINNSILQFGGRNKLLLKIQNEHHKGYTCSKIDCDFCYRLHLKIDPEKEITFRRKKKFVKQQVLFQERYFSRKNFHY